MLRRSLPAVWAALLAVLLQMPLGPAAMAVPHATPFGAGYGHICGAPGDDAAPAHHAPGRHGMDCLQCPFCAALASHVIVLPGGIASPAPRRPSANTDAPFVATATWLPPVVAAFDARGPPRLV